MSDLKKALDSARKRLKSVSDAIHAQYGVLTSGHFSDDGVKLISARSDCFERLDSILGLMKVRDAAENALSVHDADIKGRPNSALSEEIDYFETSLPCSDARLLVLNTYLASTWMVYDRLMGCIGKIMGPTAMLKDERFFQQAKLFETFVPEKGEPKIDDFSIGRLVRDAYTWPIAISYQLRNAFVHDGGYIDNDFLLDKTQVGKMFNLSAQGALAFEKCLTKRLNVNSVPSQYSLDATVDVRILLKSCTSEIDELLCSLVNSAAAGIWIVAKTFLGRDGFTL